MKTKHLSNILLASLLVALGQAGSSQTKLLDFLQDETPGARFFDLQQHRRRACRGQAHQQAVVCPFRCIPCHFCKGVDLSQFQFDYDLNWAAMFVNADTLCTHVMKSMATGADVYNSIASLEKTMRCSRSSRRLSE